MVLTLGLVAFLMGVINISILILILWQNYFAEELNVTILKTKQTEWYISAIQQSCNDFTLCHSKMFVNTKEDKLWHNQKRILHP